MATRKFPSHVHLIACDERSLICFSGDDGILELDPKTFIPIAGEEPSPAIRFRAEHSSLLFRSARSLGRRQVRSGICRDRSRPAPTLPTTTPWIGVRWVCWGTTCSCCVPRGASTAPRFPRIRRWFLSYDYGVTILMLLQGPKRLRAVADASTVILRGRTGIAGSDELRKLKVQARRLRQIGSLEPLAGTVVEQNRVTNRIPDGGEPHATRTV